MSKKLRSSVTTAKIADRLVKEVLPADSHTNNKQLYPLQQRAVCLLLKVYLNLSYRNFEEWLKSNADVCEAIGLQQVPHQSTLQRWNKKLSHLDFENLKKKISDEERLLDSEISPDLTSFPSVQSRLEHPVPQEQTGKPLLAKNSVQNGIALQMNDLEKIASAKDSSWSSRVLFFWLAGMMALLPIKLLNLPLNFELVDIWILGGLPIVLYLYVLRKPHLISFSYTIPMWFVLTSSFISAFTSPAPTRSMIVILKEVYLFVWFFVVMALLFQLSAKNLRSLMRVWSVVVILHGALMIAQFFSPAVWQFTNELGGNTARYDVYRAAGLFICDKAGCANKAAFFQLLGFAPLLLAGFSNRKTLMLGLFQFASMMTTGSMGATLAFTSGLFVAVFAVAFYKKSLSIVIKYFFRIVLAIIVLGGVLYIIGSQSPDTADHFQRIIVGRFDKSSGGRFNLWGRGIDVLLDHNAFFWGVGPENFRVVDAAQRDNQLHNDTLAFLVERGLIGLVGLGLFAAITLIKGVQILEIFRKNPKRARLGVVVFLAILGATMVESLTHQVFHTRELWLILAVQEAVLYKMTTAEFGIEPIVQSKPKPAKNHPGFVTQPEAVFNR